MNFILNTRGFRGVNNNCFINCLMMSLFGYKYSDFIRLFKMDKNKELIVFIFNLVNELERDTLPDATNLRNIFPNNLRHGQQDTSEVYDFLMNLLDFQPIKIKYKKIYKTENNEKKKVLEKASYVSYINIENDGIDDFNIINKVFKPSWNDLGSDKSNWVNDSNNVPYYRYIKTKINKLESNCLVFSINRGNYNTKKYSNRIECPRFVKLANVSYFRFAMILHINSNNSSEYGHYNVVLSDTSGNDYVYDDSNTSRKILQNKVDLETINSAHEKNCTMVFYYKIV